MTVFAGWRYWAGLALVGGIAAWVVWHWLSTTHL